MFFISLSRFCACHSPHQISHFDSIVQLFIPVAISDLSVPDHIKRASKCLGAQQISLIFYSFISTLPECVGTSFFSEAIHFRRISLSGVILCVIMCNFHTGDMCGLFLFAGLFLSDQFISTDLPCRFGIRQFIDECRWPVKCDSVEQTTVTGALRANSRSKGVELSRDSRSSSSWSQAR